MTTNYMKNDHQYCIAVADIVAFLSSLYRIEPGDLIYTGTPRASGRLSPVTP